MAAAARARLHNCRLALKQVSSSLGLPSISDAAIMKMPSPHQSVKVEKLGTIEATRGLAALLVAFFHGSHVVELFKKGWGAPFGGFFNFGDAGVPFFFVLSGFIIFHIHRCDIDCPSKLANFFWKRVTRIYPLFLVVMIPITIKYVATGAFEWEHFLKSLFLLPQTKPPMLIQSWTLVHEFLFYILFGLSIWNLRLSQLVLIAWLMLFCSARWFEPDLDPGFMSDLIRTLLSTYNLLFLFGIASAWIIQHALAMPYARLLAVFGCLGFLATGLIEVFNLYPSLTGSHTPLLLYGLNSAFIIVGLVTAEFEGGIRSGRFAILLGSLSYPLYLTHGMVIAIFIHVMHKIDYSGPGWLLLLLAVAVACMAAMLVHHYIEMPMAIYLKRMWNRRKQLHAFS